MPLLPLQSTCHATIKPQGLRMCDVSAYVPLFVGRSKGKAGIHLKYYPESRDTFEMYPGKVMYMIGG